MSKVGHWGIFWEALARPDVYIVRVKHSAEIELSAIENGVEKQQIEELLLSLEEHPFPPPVIILEPQDAYALICGRFYITYIVNADDVVVYSIRIKPEKPA